MHDVEHVSFSTNNYLGIASCARMKAAAIAGIQTYGVGNCESRLLSGNLQIYNELEEVLARSKGQTRALLFATGYLANIGTLSTLPRAAYFARPLGFSPSRDYSYAYFSDEFNHISIREGIKASGAARATYRHLDLNHLSDLLTRSKATSKIIVTDGVFSQDGDIAPIPELLQLAERHDAMLYIDDAHGTGVLGPHGQGVLDHFGVSSDRIIYMGTLSKAYGSIGGFVATNAVIVEILRLACSAYGFTSTLPPDQVLAVREAIDIAADEPERRERLWANQRYFVKRMSGLDEVLLATDTPILPVLVRDGDKADQLTAILHDEQIHVDAIKFPAVAVDGARIRIQINANHSLQDIDKLVDVLKANAGLLASAVPIRLRRAARL
jgi:8-amino-7-oxononanoate synthase